MAAAGVTTRRATVEDVPAVRPVYDRVGRRAERPADPPQRVVPAADEEYLADVTGITLALDGAGEVVGLAAWRRGEGYEPSTATIEVDDLIALSPDAHRALWRVLGSFSSVTGRVRLRTSGDDPARLVLPGGTWHVVGTHPYGLRLLDVERAFALRPLEQAPG